MSKNIKLSNKLIVVAGSKKLISDEEKKIALAKALGSKIIQEPNWILFNGGAKNIDKSDSSTAIDYFTCLGAFEEIKKNKNLVADKKILTLHPQTSDHSHHNIGFVEVSERKTPTLRRFDLVARSDVIITIEGLEGLTTMIELAISLGKPILPIPNTGGKSLEAWELYGNEIMDKFYLKPEQRVYKLLTSPIGSIDILADAVIEVVKKALNPTCFVAMQFGGEYDQLYREVLVSCIQEAGYVPVRGDELLSANYVIVDIFEAIRNAELIIADITDASPNVMYEVGIGHALNKDIIFLCQKDESGSFKTTLPFDIRMFRVFGYNKNQLHSCKNEFFKVIQSYKRHK